MHHQFPPLPQSPSFLAPPSSKTPKAEHRVFVFHKKIGVVSDTHNLVRKELFSVFNTVDLIIHAGDIGDQNVLIELESLAPVKAVLGNNDWQLPVKYKEKLTFNLCNKTIFIQHIFNDLPKEKKQKPNLIKNIIIFGHSHKPLIQQSGDTLYFNPGSAGPKRFNLPITVGLLELFNHSVESKIISLLTT